jgi:hypothetical protein
LCIGSVIDDLKLAEGERGPNGTCEAVLIVSHRYCALGDLHFGEVHLLLAPMAAL